jgi:hypothetical protein
MLEVAAVCRGNIDRLPILTRIVRDERRNSGDVLVSPGADYTQKESFATDARNYRLIQAITVTYHGGAAMLRESAIGGTHDSAHWRTMQISPLSPADFARFAPTLQ